MCGLDQGFNKIIALAYLTTGRKAWQPHFCFNGDVCVREVISLPKDIVITIYYLKYYFLCLSIHNFACH